MGTQNNGWVKIYFPTLSLGTSDIFIGHLSPHYVNRHHVTQCAAEPALAYCRNKMLHIETVILVLQKRRGSNMQLT